MEKELLSIVEILQQCCHILPGNHCRFHCDHKTLDFTTCVRRWQATIEEFDYSFIYFSGKDNTIADILSQYPMTSVETPNFEEIATLEDFSFPATTFNIKQSQDSLTASLCQLAFGRDMDINELYLADRKDLSVQHQTQVRKNDTHEKNYAFHTNTPLVILFISTSQKWSVN
jgi:hypothetical protein